MSRSLAFTLLALLFFCSTVRAEPGSSTCRYWSYEMGLTKHNDCLVHLGNHAMRVNSIYLRQLPFNGKYATIFNDKYGWMYIDRKGAVVVKHVMPLDNGADYLQDGLVRYTRYGKCGYASLDNNSTIPPQFDGCLPFSNGKAQVCNACRPATTGEYNSYKGGNWFCINTKGQHTSCRRSPYKRAYWVATSKDQRTQFIAGYIDCAVEDKGRNDLENSSWHTLELKISRFYASHPKTKLSVPNLISKFRQKASPPPGGEYHPEGIFHGQYWFEITPTERIGFVNGYLSCMYPARRKPTDSLKPVTWIVKEINSYYKIKDDGSIDDHRATTRISLVIHKLTSTP